MSLLEIMHKEHDEILGKVHFFMAQLLHSLKMTFEDHPEHVKEFTEFVKEKLLSHWKVEEEFIYPILETKVDPLIITNLVFDHERINSEFNTYLRYVMDSDLSNLHLTHLINYLEIHARKEEELFASVISAGSLSQEELKTIEEAMKH